MSPSREAELLAADRFAGSLGIALVSAGETRVEVEMVADGAHVDGSGRLRPAVAFTLADCAMSLISNATTRAFAVSAHLVAAGTVELGEPLRAVAVPAHRTPGRVTWHVTVSAPAGTVATFTGTTLEVPAT